MAEERERGTRIQGELACIGIKVGRIPNGRDEPCTSSDAMSLYEHTEKDGTYYSATCFSCMQGFSDKELKLAETIEEGETPTRNRSSVEKKRITREEMQALSVISGPEMKGNTYRGLKEEFIKFFGHRFEYHPEGTLKKLWYPETQSNKIFGFKPRQLPKGFGSPIGWTGTASQLSGQHKFSEGGKYVLLVGGENDKVAAFQMLTEYQRRNGNTGYAPFPVVSGTCGEGSLANQAKNQYEWLDTFDNIVIGLDMDDAGDAATEALIKVLPKDKIRIAKWHGNDPHKMLEDGLKDQFLSDFYSANPLVETGIKTSTGSIEAAKEVLLAVKVTLPDYMKILEENMRRAFSTAGKIVNIIGNTSCGKSTHVNNMGYHWMFQEGLKPLVISIEKTRGEYTLDMLSIHLEKNLGWFRDGQDAVDYLEKPEVIELYKDLLVDEKGEERWCIVDDRDGKVGTIQKQIERGVKQYGCNIVIIDVLSDIIRALPTNEQEDHMQWQKLFVKGGVSIVNVLHTKKLTKDKDGKAHKTTEYDALGTGAIVQSAHINIVINRDKMAKTDLEKNTTEVDMPKCREGTTGPAGEWIYEPATRKLYDSEDYVKIHSKEDVAKVIEAATSPDDVEKLF